MTFLDTVKSGITTAVDTVTEVTQNLIDKNRANAQLNRLRSVMKRECEMINRAYITLGKNYYENKTNNKNNTCPNEEELFKVIQQSKENIKKARDRYRQVIESQTPDPIEEFNLTDLEDITVSCSNESEYEASPFVEVQPEASVTITVETAEVAKGESDVEVADDEEV